jgi:hypothetical protein
MFIAIENEYRPLAPEFFLRVLAAVAAPVALYTQSIVPLERSRAIVDGCRFMTVAMARMRIFIAKNPASCSRSPMQNVGAPLRFSCTLFCSNLIVQRLRWSVYFFPVISHLV